MKKEVYKKLELMFSTKITSMSEEDKVIAEAAVEKHNIPIETIPMIKEDLDKTAYILIRHGLSTFNHKNLEVKLEFGNGSDEWRAV